MSLRRIAVSTLALASLGGCDASSDPHEGFSVVDSLGVLIAQSTDSTWTTASAWRISPDPILRIGTAAGDVPGADFSYILGAASLADGRVVIADRSSAELRIFDRDGEFVMALGGSGQGPHEFQILDSRLGVLADGSVVARDVGVFKSVSFEADGTPGPVLTGPPIGWNGLWGVFVAGWLADGSFIVSNTVQSGQLPPGRTLAEQEWHHFDASGEHRGMIARLPSYHAVDREHLGLGPLSTTRVVGDGFWHAFPSTYELRRYTPEGLVRIVRRSDWTPEPVSGSVAAAYRSWELEGLSAIGLPPALNESQRARLERMVLSDFFPAFATFFASRDGHLWVQHAVTAQEVLDPDRDRRLPVPYWTVFDPEGRWLGTVTMPDGLRLLEIGADHVMGVETDELGVQYLVIYGIERP